MNKIRSIKELNLIEDFLCQEVLSDPQYGNIAARLLVEALTGDKLEEVTVHTQKIMTSGDPRKRGIRMDVYIDEHSDKTHGRIYDIEPQTGDYANLPNRSRIYQAIVDSKMLNPREPYAKLRQLWIIIITPTDVFGHGRMRYTFEQRCSEQPELALNDGAKRIFFNCSGKIDTKEELTSILNYITDSRDENVVDETTRQLHQIVQNVKEKAEVEVRYMNLLEREWRVKKEATEYGLANGLKQGLEQGLEQSLVTLVCKKLKKGMALEMIAEALEEEPSKIKPIIDIATRYAPDYDIDKICQEVRASKPLT